MKSYLLGALCACILATFSAPNSAYARPYSFNVIASDVGGTFNFIGQASINDQGAVAFAADGGAYVWSNGTYTTIATNDVTGPPVINNNGTVAFLSGQGTTAQVIYTGSGGALTTIAQENDQLGQFAPQVSINDNNTVVFDVGLDGVSGTDAILAGSGGAVSTLYDKNDVFSFKALTTINNNGVVVFGGRTDPSTEAIFTGNGGPLSTLYEETGDFFVLSTPAINDNGTVAFPAWLDPGGIDADSGIFVGDGGAITTLADTTSGEFSSFGFSSINNAEEVAFFAVLPDGSQGIFTGADPVADKVIATGDSLDGLTVTSAAPGPTSSYLNNNGEIAFLALLSDGSRRIVIASPVPVPPAVWLFGSGLLGLVGIARRNKE